MFNISALKSGILLGTILQLAMVIAGHFIPAIEQYGFALGGMAISCLAGYVSVRHTSSSWGLALLSGAVVGGMCALIGIAVSTALGDVPAFILLIGTASSTVTGCVGAAFAKVTGRNLF